MSDMSSFDFEFEFLEIYTDRVYDSLWDSDSNTSPVYTPPEDSEPHSSYETMSRADCVSSVAHIPEITNEDIYESQWDCNVNTTSPDVTEWIVVSVDKVNDIVPFWLAGIEAEKRGETPGKLSDFIDELQMKHNEKYGLTELWESEERPNVIVWTEK